MGLEQCKALFEALARMDASLSNVCERAIDTIKDDNTASTEEKNKVKGAVKDLLRGNLELHSYLKNNHPEYDFIGQGSDEYQQLKRKYDSN